MNEHDIRLAEALMDYLVEKNGRANSDQYVNHLMAQNFKFFSIPPVRNMLVSRGFVEFEGEQQYFISLTERGWEVAREKTYFRGFIKPSIISTPTYRQRINKTIDGIVTGSKAASQNATLSKVISAIIIGVLGLLWSWFKGWI